MHESTLLALLLRIAPRELPDLRLFRRTVMRVRIPGSLDRIPGPGATDRTVQVGIKGQCDVYGLVRGGGHLELELKGPHTTVTAHQKRWAAFCHLWGVPHLLLRARAGETPEATVARWVEEIRKIINYTSTGSGSTL
jgi:hypothetical protein